jgi:uncharacterized protein YcbK (DUF882 family)
VERSAPLFPEAKQRHRVYRGLTERQERIFHWIALGIILLFVSGWVGTIITIRRQQRELQRTQARTGVVLGAPTAVPATRQMTAAVLDADAPKTAYLNEALMELLDPLRGESGALRFAAREPGKEIVENYVAPQNPGIYKLASVINQATTTLDDFSLITLVPLSRKRSGKIGLYYLGNWPFEKGGRPKSPTYATPSGFIEVTPQNQDTYISEHFRLRDFLTKDQRNVWPKYMPLNPKLIDKLELTIQELQSSGITVKHVHVMSGFRTPHYNERGGNTGGRANLSRHMYGDAADVYVDNNRDGAPDDINRDGRVNTRDAEVFGQAAERVERKHPSLVGGIGVYPACCGHGPFTHLDVRGYRARWRGSGTG